MKIVIFAMLGIFFSAVWTHDFVKWCQSFNSKDFGWRMADFTITNLFIIALVWLAGRCA